MKFTLNFDGVEYTKAPIRSISPDGDYFFGYYDLIAYSPDNRRHLANRLPFGDHINGPNDVLGLGEIDLETGKYTEFATTKAWSFQQGAMLQYAGNGTNTVFYNIYDEEAKTFRMVRHNLDTDAKDYSDRACATVASNARYGLAVNFARIWDFRKGYGYSNIPDAYANVNQPSEDGIFLCDFETGTSRLLTSYERLAKEFPIKGREDGKFVVNHITFNPSGNKYLFLNRNFPTSLYSWSTSLIVGDLEGNLTPIMMDTMVSHYYWKDDDHIIAFCKPIGEVDGHYIINANDGSYVYTGSELYNKNGLNSNTDTHCSYSPDGRYLVGDDYPSADGVRRIRIDDLKTGKSGILVATYSPWGHDPEIRCDLHARFSRDSKRLSFDAASRGRREILEIDMTKLEL